MIEAVVGVFANYYFYEAVFWVAFLVWVGFWVFCRSGRVGSFNNLLGVRAQLGEEIGFAYTFCIYNCTYVLGFG